MRLFNLKTATDLGRELKSLPINMGIAAVLFGLGLLVVIEAVRVLRQSRVAPAFEPVYPARVE